MTLYVVSFSYFSHRVLLVFAQAFVIYIFRFFLLGFLKIVFILRDVQVLKRSVTTQIYSNHLDIGTSWQPPRRCVAWRPPAELSRLPPPHHIERWPHM
jgi:hypothetical protein